MENEPKRKSGKAENWLVVVTIIVTFFHAISNVIKDIAEYLGKE